MFLQVCFGVVVLEDICDYQIKYCVGGKVLLLIMKFICEYVLIVWIFVIVFCIVVFVLYVVLMRFGVILLGDYVDYEVFICIVNVLWMVFCFQVLFYVLVFVIIYIVDIKLCNIFQDCIIDCILKVLLVWFSLLLIGWVCKVIQDDIVQIYMFVVYVFVE